MTPEPVLTKTLIWIFIGPLLVIAKGIVAESCLGNGMKTGRYGACCAALHGITYAGPWLKYGIFCSIGKREEMTNSKRTRKGRMDWEDRIAKMDETLIVR